MASSYRTLASDPLRAFKYNVYIPVQTVSPDATKIVNPPASGIARLGFMSVSGLGIQIEPLTYREGGDNLTTRKLPGQADFNPITLARGMFPTDPDNWLWMMNLFTAMYGRGTTPSTIQNNPAGDRTDFRTDMYVNVLEHPNTTSQALKDGASQYQSSYPGQYDIVKISFKLYSAWIGTLAYSDFDAGGNAVAVEQMTLNYEGFDMCWPGSGYVTNPIGW
jgi:phage tail-like protein